MGKHTYFGCNTFYSPSKSVSKNACIIIICAYPAENDYLNKCFTVSCETT